MIISFELSEIQYEQASKQVSALLSEKSQLSSSILKFPIKLAIIAALFGLPLLLGVIAQMIQGVRDILLALNIVNPQTSFLDIVIAISVITLPLIFLSIFFQKQKDENRDTSARNQATPIYTLSNVSINNNKLERASLDLENSPITITFRGGEKWEIPVETIYRYTENKDFFILLADNNKALCIPKDALKNSNDMRSFKEKIEELLPYVSL